MGRFVVCSLIVVLMSCSQHYEEGAHPPPKPPSGSESPAPKSPTESVTLSFQGQFRLAEGV